MGTNGKGSEIKLRVVAGEAEAWRAAAAKAGVSLSEWVRRACRTALSEGDPREGEGSRMPSQAGISPPLSGAAVTAPSPSLNAAKPFKGPDPRPTSKARKR